MRSASEQQGENERQCQKVEHEDRQEHTTFLPKRGFKLGSFMWLLLCNNNEKGLIVQHIFLYISLPLLLHNNNHMKLPRLKHSCERNVVCSCLSSCSIFWHCRSFSPHLLVVSTSHFLTTAIKISYFSSNVNPCLSSTSMKTSKFSRGKDSALCWFFFSSKV